MGMNLIRQAVLANHGGLKDAGDAAIKTIWNSLPRETQEKYLQKIRKQKGGAKHATGTKSK